MFTMSFANDMVYPATASSLAYLAYLLISLRPLYASYMTLVHAVVLGIVQGLTEFLPVSSSGHLLLTRFLLSIPDVAGTAFDAYLHLGTLGALLVYFWRQWWEILRALVVTHGPSAQRRRGGQILLATLPAACVGYLWQDVAATWFRSPHYVALGFLITAVVIWWCDRQVTKKTSEQMTYTDAWWIGIAQVLALVPSISRSGMTIAAGRARGLSRREATLFSFLLSAPIIAGASLSSLSALVATHTFSPLSLLAGGIASFVSGLIAIVLLLKLIERISFTPFVIYLVVLAGVLFVFW